MFWISLVVGVVSFWKFGLMVSVAMYALIFLIARKLTAHEAQLPAILFSKLRLAKIYDSAERTQ